MRKQLLLLLLMAAGLKLVAQQNYFIYIQSDKYQPFYVNLDKNILSSSDKGHLIIAKLGDNDVEFIIGFPKNVFPEQRFRVAVNKKDQGFQLKNFGDKGWGLFNMQTLAIIYNDDANKKKSAEHGERRTDNFSALLANVVNDSAVLYAMKKPQPFVVTPAVVKTDTISSMNVNGTITIVTGEVAREEKETVKPVALDSVKISADSLVQETNVPAKTEGQIIIEKPAVPLNEKKDSVVITKAAPSVSVKKIVERKRTADYYMVFTDKRGTKADTIRISIALEKDSIKNQPAQQIVIETAAPPKDSALTIVKKDDTKPSHQLVIESSEPKKDSAVTAPVATANKESEHSIVIESARPKKDTVSTDPPTGNKGDSIILSNTSAAKKETEQINKEPEKKDSLVITQNMPVPSSVKNTDCENFATDNDVDKLRIKLIAEKNLDDKLFAAKKYFRTKCFQVKQLKALTELFPKDEDKYQFFDTAYPFVSDTGNFSSLEALLSDEYYKNRFKAMIRK